MPVLTMSDGSVLALFARAHDRIERHRQDELLATLEAQEARQVALLLLKRKTDAPVAPATRRAAQQLREWAASLE